MDLPDWAAGSVILSWVTNTRLGMLCMLMLQHASQLELILYFEDHLQFKFSCYRLCLQFKNWQGPQLTQ